LVGYSEEELVGKPIADLSHPDDVLADAEFNEELLAGELDSYQREKRYVRKDGEVIWVCPTISAVRDNGGVPRFLVGMVEDITERRRTEEALRRSEASLAEAQRIARIGNWSYEVGKDRMRWSDEMYRIFGFVPQGFVPAYKVLMLFVHPDDRGRLRRAVRGALYQGGDEDIEYRIVRPDGEVRAVRTQYEMIHDEDGAPAELVGTVQDITERQEAEQKLGEAEERYRLLVEQIPAVAYIDRADVADAAFYTSPRIEALLG